MSTTLSTAFSEEKPKDLVLIGITGGIGSGKSAVATILREMGEHVLSADSIAKEVMLQSEVQRAINDVFEMELFPDGKVDRATLSELVFGNTDEHRENLEVLNGIVHPFVIERLLGELHTLRDAGASTVYNESALIYESGFEDIYDYIVSVTAEDDVRTKRLVDQRGLTPEDVDARMENQWSQSEKDRLADFTIANNGSLEQLREAVANLHVILSFLQPRTPDADE